MCEWIGRKIPEWKIINMSELVQTFAFYIISIIFWLCIILSKLNEYIVSLLKHYSNIIILLLRISNYSEPNIITINADHLMQGSFLFKDEAYIAWCKDCFVHRSTADLSMMKEGHERKKDESFKYNVASVGSMIGRIV